MDAGAEQVSLLSKMRARVDHLQVQLNHVQAMDDGIEKITVLTKVEADLNELGAQLDHIKKQMRDYFDLHNVLLQDLQEGQEARLQSPDSQFTRRTFVRVLFSLIEGQVFANKQFALAVYNAGQVRFSQAELALLHEKQYFLDEKGKAESQPVFLSLKKNIRFSFEVCARACESNYKLDCGRQGWKAFTEAVKCRDRITHPKNARDLTITDVEMASIGTMTKWYLTSERELVESVRQSFGV